MLSISREKIGERARQLTALLAVVFCSAMMMLWAPRSSLAGGHGGMGGGCGCGSDYYDYYYNSLYPWYNQAGRTGAILGTYPNYYAYSPLYSYPYSSLLPSTYSNLYNFYQPYGYNPILGNSLLYPYGQVNSKEYAVEQSKTVYVPGGEVTTTVSESSEVSTLPQYTPYMLYNFPYGYSYGYSPYTLGAGNYWANLAGLGWYY